MKFCVSCLLKLLWKQNNNYLVISHVVVLLEFDHYYPELSVIPLKIVSNGYHNLVSGGGGCQGSE